MENKLITVSGVTGYIDENGTAMLNLENCARGLGFTTVATSGNECVRWSRVEQYLTELGFNHDNGYFPDNTFIPENIFYRLAMKASNKTAIDFQCKIADEILPSIRKTGTYSVKSMTQAELIFGLAQCNVELEKKVLTLDSKVTNALEVFSKAVEPSWKESMNKTLNGLIKTHRLNYQVFKGDLYAELDRTAQVSIAKRQTNLRKRTKQGGATVAECTAITKLDIIDRNPQLRLIFEGIVRKYQAKYVVGV